jgi:hypothetical protein
VQATEVAVQTMAEKRAAHTLRVAAAVAFWAMTVLFVADVAVLQGWVSAAELVLPWVAGGADPLSEPTESVAPAPSPTATVIQGPDTVELGGAEVEFPQPARQSSSPREIAGEITTVVVATALDEEGSTFSVAVVDYPESVDLSDPAVNLLASVSGAAGNVGGRIMEQTVTLFDDAPAVTFRIETPTVQLAGRNVLVGRRMFAQSVAFQGDDDPPAAKDFFDSFRLTSGR